MIHFRPSVIATMVTSALTVGSITAVNAAPSSILSINNSSSASILSILAKSTAIARKALANQPTVSGMKNSYDDKLNQPTFIWKGYSPAQARPEMVMVALEQRNEFAANHYLNALTGMSASKATGSKAKLNHIHDIGRGGIIARYQQELHGIEVFNRSYNVMMDRDHNLVAGSGYFAQTGATAKIVKQATLNNTFGNPVAAVNTAFADMGGQTDAIQLALSKTVDRYTEFSVTNGTQEKQLIGQPRTKRVYFESKGELLAAHYVEVKVGDVDTTDSQYYSFVIDASSNRVLFKNNLTVSHHHYRVFADSEAPHAPWDSPHGNVNPADSPDQVDTTIIKPASLVRLNTGPIITEDPWLEHDATETIGNNVSAYVDVLAPDGLSTGDFTAGVTSPGTFDYQLTADEREFSINNRKAAIVNLFYVNNYLHDEFYNHGFDEAAGNAQLSNMERGGEENDPLLVEGQDYSGINNANMSTPADGASPRMQMFLWDQGVDRVHYGVDAVSHPELGSIGSGNALFGQIVFDLTGDVVRLQDGEGASQDGCEPAINPEDLAGKIALIDRGVCNFSLKVKHAQDAGAIGAVVSNNRDGDALRSMPGVDSSITIPSMFVSQNSGIAFDQIFDAEQELSLRIFGLGNVPFKGSSWDNAIVSHEWGHYISNRLVGNASGLSNNQGGSMGEGWGDFHALLTVSSADEALIAGNEMFQKPYAAVTYVRSFYHGIRRYPYTTDMDINPHTFDNIEDNAAVHASGNVWSTMLWDVYVSLINDSRHTFAEARSHMMDYLVMGYKMTPNAPTFVEARDAILAAAYANDVEDYNVMLAAFAKRGIGLGALAPDRDSNSHMGVVESYATEHSSLQMTSHALDLNYAGLTSGFCSNDGVLDKGETATATFTIHNRGSEAYTNVLAKIEVLSAHDVTLPNDGMITFESLGVTGSATSAPVEFVLNETGIAEDLEFKVSFPELATQSNEQAYEFSTVVHYDFIAKPISGRMAHSDAEDIAINNDLKEHVMAGGELAKNTGGFSRDYADFWIENFDLDMGQGSLFINNNGFESDVAYETRPITVSLNGNFQVNWTHFYFLEQDFDGGVVEIKINDADWMDVLDAGGQFLGAGYDGDLVDHSSQPLPNRDTFTGFGVGAEGVVFDTLLNGNTVQFRFRATSDGGASSMGWLIDDITFSSIESPVFSEVIAGDTNACDNRTPFVSIGEAQSVSEGATITLSVDASDLNGDILTYNWTQLSGPEVELTDADTATPSFAAPAVDELTDLEFMVTVNDGSVDVTRNVTVSVADVPPPPAPTSVNRSGGGSTGLLGLLLLPLVMVRRRLKSNG
ncbi:MAG: hypothetical protein ACI9FJ_001792 [Alteromonadaceae bacterium]|jgi:hypothetical protein